MDRALAIMEEWEMNESMVCTLIAYYAVDRMIDEGLLNGSKVVTDRGTEILNRLKEVNYAPPSDVLRKDVKCVVRFEFGALMTKEGISDGAIKNILCESRK